MLFSFKGGGLEARKLPVSALPASPLLLLSCGHLIRNKYKKLYRAFGRQANGLTLNIPVLEGLLRVNRKAEKDA